MEPITMQLNTKKTYRNTTLLLLTRLRIYFRGGTVLLIKMTRFIEVIFPAHPLSRFLSILQMPITQIPVLVALIMFFYPAPGREQKVDMICILPISKQEQYL